MPTASSITAFLKNAGTGTWIDIACLVLVLVFVAVGARRGLSDIIGALLGLFAGFNAGLWISPSARSALGGVAFFKHHAALHSISALVLAILLGAVVFVVVRTVLTRFFRLVVEPPLDNILGAIAGLAKALLIILAIFTCARLLPGDPLGGAISSSRVGPQVVPAAMRAFGAAQPNGMAHGKGR